MAFVTCQLLITWHLDMDNLRINFSNLIYDVGRQFIVADTYLSTDYEMKTFYL